MKLTLDYTQRLNLHALMGAQRVNVDELRLYWRLQDMIELTAKEKLLINYRTFQQNGQQQVQWDMGRDVLPQDYEFAPDEIQRIARMVREWQPGFLPGADRQWIEPLLTQLDGALASLDKRAENGAVRGPMEGGLGGMALPRTRSN
jgi:hypothetical protein